MSLILRRTLIFITLLVAGLLIYTLWFGMKADRYDDTAVPYLESALPIVTSWQFEQLRPLLSPTARLEFENQKVRQAYQSFSRLGQLKSTGKPKYLWDRVDTSKSLGDIEIIGYQVPLEFDSGPATIKINLVADGKSYNIQHFGIHSEVFADQQTAN